MQENFQVEDLFRVLQPTETNSSAQNNERAVSYGFPGTYDIHFKIKCYVFVKE